MKKSNQNTPTTQDELDRRNLSLIFSDYMRGQWNGNMLQDILDWHNSEVNKVLDSCIDSVDEEIKASSKNLAYAEKNHHSERAIANWKGCIEGEKFCKSAIQKARRP